MDRGERISSTSTSASGSFPRNHHVSGFISVINKVLYSQATPFLSLNGGDKPDPASRHFVNCCAKKGEL
jgi:hypothetical protein